MPVAPNNRRGLSPPLRGTGPIPEPAMIAFDPRYVGIYERFEKLVGTAASWDYNATEDNTEVEVTNTQTLDWQLLANGSGTCTRSTAGGIILTTGATSGNDTHIVPNAASGAATNATNFNKLVWDFDLQNIFLVSLTLGASVTAYNIFAGFKVDNDFGVDDADLFGFSLVTGSDTSWALAARRNSTDLFDSNSYGGSSQTRVYDTGLVAVLSTTYYLGGWVDSNGYMTWFISGANNNQPYVTTLDEPGILSVAAGAGSGGLRGGTSSVHPFIGVETTENVAKTVRVRNCGFWQLHE